MVKRRVHRPASENKLTTSEQLQLDSEMDGTIFVRAAGIVMDSLGWVDYGQEARTWDRSALGWDAAWDNEE